MKWPQEFSGAWPDPPEWIEAEELATLLRFGLAPSVGHPLFTDAKRAHTRLYKPAPHIAIDEARERRQPDHLRCDRCGERVLFEPPDLAALKEQLVRFIFRHRHH